MLEVDVVNLASEFPNDNPALHRGVIWVCLEPTGHARPERVYPPSEPRAATEPPPAVVVSPAADVTSADVASAAAEASPDVTPTVAAEAASDVAFAAEMSSDVAFATADVAFVAVEACSDGTPTVAAEASDAVTSAAEASAVVAPAVVASSDGMPAVAEADVEAVITERTRASALEDRALSGDDDASSGVAACDAAAGEGSEALGLRASAHDSLAPPEDDQEDEAAGPIVVEELEPIEASVEGVTASLEVVTASLEAGGAVAEAALAESAVAEAALAEPAVAEAALAEPAVAEAALAEPAVAEAAPAEPAVAEAARDVPAPARSDVVLVSPRAEVDVARDLEAIAGDVAASSAVDVTPRFDEIVACEAPVHDSSALPPAPDDPFTVLVCTLADVAIGAGSPHVASLLPGLLYDGRLPDSLDAEAAEALRGAGVLEGSEVAPAFLAVTSAWRAILRGTSDDFDACGASMLDEWASDLLARMLAAPASAPSLRQELRTRGVAAFGLAA
ncbi:MAG: hypothetical protein KF782_31895 [Labilithrix sp.]|nr:hypothetical protein [Labilithrix sp.]